MTDRVRIETQHLRGVAGDLDGVADSIQAILSRLTAASSAHWGRWGDDDFGRQFSGGDNGYVKSDQNLQSVIGSRAEMLRSYSQGLRDAAQHLDDTEQGNTDGFR
ncbi:WXG100 family type VII secretion target [Nocardia sp. alder85J]|uniref:WXG100 family type VII secretion target n=1 Tax=Nocardia sp. alder85J TaxID=2862949 RepID=UPI001CD7C47B|nr:type VII secretion target [Nocardia sp. alder85J]MCX4093042.1 type VII secretion target [Nocardia sp. alder85J]